MENFDEKAVCSDGNSPNGPFDACLDCPRRAVACSGPRTTAMSHDRYIAWMLRLFEKWDGTRQDLADVAGVSKSTIDDFFAGRRKDISRTTAGLLENILIGGDSKWPCAMLVDKDKEVVYEDRPETLEALRVNMEANQHKDIQIVSMRKTISDIREDHARELARMKQDYEENISEYKELVAHMREQIARKDDYIDRLAKKAGI